MGLRLCSRTLVHVRTVTISLSTLSFPAIFTPGYIEEFAPANLLFPRNTTVSTIGAGVLHFMQWDQWIGYSAVLIWAVSLRRGSYKHGPTTWALSALEVILGSILLGPGGATV